ncbi:MAG TPA: GNAT family N-acetyltransferase [Prolixibacteraceae bacterium]|nr:GNAT family N-acetyltransferase [Prolixibacteraceae bacterium]
MNLEVRIATNTDLDELIGLLNDLFTQDIEFEPNYEIQKAGLEKIVYNPEIGEILVLLLDNKVIGMVSLLYSISTALGGKVAILEDMIIHKDYRSKGFGKQLLQEAINFSVKRDCLRITLLTDFNNDIAINFYEGFGFKKSDMIPLRLITT